MEFEEFFKKKRINLPALLQAEPALFSEFETHYARMGEKSFDHTKKYWFNKLRREYPAPVEEKTEKVKIDNPLAEQTITESLDEQIATAPKLGFTPKFRAAAVPGPEEKPAEEKFAGETPAPAAPKPGFTPRFKAASMATPVDKPAERVAEEKPTEEASTPVAPKPGFTPRFKAANLVKPNPGPSEEKPADIPVPEIPPVDDAPKPAYKPRFNVKNLPKKEE
jgi:hypothetical protein